MSDRIDNSNLFFGGDPDFSGVSNPDFASDGNFDFSLFLAQHPEILSMLGGVSNTSMAEQAAHSPPETPSALLSPQPVRRRSRVRVRDFNPQYIPRTLCLRHEYLGLAQFLTRFNARITVNNVLISPLYPCSFVWEQTLLDFGFTPRYRLSTTMINPRGGLLQPVGISALPVWLNGPSPEEFSVIWCYVLPGSPAPSGVSFIVGRSDIDRIWGDGWTPQQHVMRLSRVEAWSGTFSSGSGFGG